MKRLILIVFVLFTGCGLSTTELRQQGFNTTQRGFITLPDMKGEVIVHAKDVYVHFVSRDRMKELIKEHKLSSGCAGFVNTKNHIYINGRMVGDKITINQNILGHELNHLLNWKNPIIANPDKLSNMGG